MRKFFVAAALSLVAMFGSVTTTDAAFRIRATSSVAGTFINVTDNGAGDLLSGNDGVILVAGVSGGATINVNVASSKPAIGSAASPELSLGFTISQMGSGVAQTITIEVTDTDFTPITSGELISQIGGTLVTGRSTVTDNSHIGNTNAEFETGTGNQTVQLGTFSSPDNFSGAATFGPSNTQPYSLTKVITIVLGAGNGTGYDTSGNAKITSTPAPAALLMAFTALPVLGIGACLRRRRTLASA
jgi:hypothetical protein